MFRVKLSCVMMLGSVMMLAVYGGCGGKTKKSQPEGAVEATIAELDAEKGIVDLEMPSDGTQKTFKLAEEIEYVDSMGNVADADIFTSGDTVLIVEVDGTITKMTKKTSKPPASKANNAKVEKTTAAFVQMADQIDMAEMKIGKIAEERAASEVVKKFAARMVLDHSNMNKDLRAMATKKGITLEESLDSVHQELLDQLSKLKGAEFDQSYSKDMVAGHEKAIAQFENEAKTGADPDVKAWAEKWRPTLREHLALAKDAVKDVQGK